MIRQVKTGKSQLCRESGYPVLISIDFDDFDRCLNIPIKQSPSGVFDKLLKEHSLRQLITATLLLFRKT